MTMIARLSQVWRMMDKNWVIIDILVI